MRVLVYEYITGGGLWHEELDAAACRSLQPEGQAMVTAVVSDLLAAGGGSVRSQNYEPICFCDTRSKWQPPLGAAVIDVPGPADELRLLRDVARSVDGVIVIAPEIGNRLLQRCQIAADACDQMLSPDVEFVALATDKTRTLQRLAENGVPVPVGRELLPSEAPPQDFPYPAVLKPNDGVGALDTYYLANRQAAAAIVRRDTAPVRLEQYCHGTAASVAVLAGGSGTPVLLAAVEQRVEMADCVTYAGGRLPLPPALAARAKTLAGRVAAALPRAVGYWGIDMILGAARDGSEDVVLEVNPRLTTSYVGLRQLARVNLAQLMIQQALGDATIIDVSYRPGVVEFTTDGRVRHGPLAVGART